MGLYLAGSAHAQSSAERAKLIDDARKEAKVVFYTGASANGGNALKAAFEKKYPFIKMEYFRAGKDKLLGRYLTEARNNTFLADVYQGSVFPLATLQQRGIARPSPTPFMTACGQGRLLGTRGVERHDHRLQAGWSKATRSRRITKISYCPSGRASSASISTKPHGTSSARKTKTVTATSITSTSGER